MDFFLHSILEAVLAFDCSGNWDANNVPILLFLFFDQWTVDLGAHWRENTLVGNCAIKYLLDGFRTWKVSRCSSQKSGLRHYLRFNATEDKRSDNNALSSLGFLQCHEGTESEVTCQLHTHTD